MQANRNKIFLRGQVSAPPISSHINHGVEYLMIPLAVRRLSGAEDTLHVVAAQEQLANLVLEPGAPLTVRGEVRTFNNRSGVGRRLVVSVFARELSQEDGEDENRLELSGTLCKPPALRATPLGRTICDMILAINPPIRPGRLPALYRLGQSGLPVRVHGGGGPPGSGGAVAEPHLHQGGRRTASGANRF